MVSFFQRNLLPCNMKGSFVLSSEIAVVVSVPTANEATSPASQQKEGATTQALCELHRYSNTGPI